MKNVIVLLADGFEEMEATLPIDLMRRAGLTVTMVSMGESLRVMGSRNIVFEADIACNEINDVYIEKNLPDAVFLPGGLGGSNNLAAHPLTKKIIEKMIQNDKLVAVICAAPVIVLAPLGLLDGKKFTCYPGMEKLKQYTKTADLSGYSSQKVVKDGNLITSQGPGTAAELAFTLIELLVDKESSDKVKKEALFA